MKAIAIAVLAALAAGCATKTVSVTYMSDPPGAVLYQNGKNYGYTPVTLHYNINKADIVDGKTRLTSSNVQWASGATAGISFLTLNIEKYGKNHSYTFKRPDDVPGLDTDMRFALEVERNRIMKQQASASNTSALADIASTLDSLNSLKESSRQQQRLTTCQTYQSGRWLNTTCQ